MQLPWVGARRLLRIYRGGVNIGRVLRCKNRTWESDEEDFSKFETISFDGNEQREGWTENTRKDEIDERETRPMLVTFIWSFDVSGVMAQEAGPGERYYPQTLVYLSAMFWSKYFLNLNKMRSLLTGRISSIGKFGKVAHLFVYLQPLNPFLQVFDVKLSPRLISSVFPFLRRAFQHRYSTWSWC
jgi:hypothetical protein